MICVKRSDVCQYHKVGYDEKPSWLCEKKFGAITELLKKGDVAIFDSSGFFKVVSFEDFDKDYVVCPNLPDN